VAPSDPAIPRFVAEPPQDAPPAGRWADQLRDEFLAACTALDTQDEDIGEPGEITWYPDRSWYGRTYVPCTAPTSHGYELFGYVRFVPASAEHEAHEFWASADFTGETAERNPDWTLDLCDEVIGSWRGEKGAVAAMTLVWGRPLLADGVSAVAQLGELTVDSCALVENGFTLIAPDDYAGQLLEIALFDADSQELARESLYDPEDAA
jgi:hypothetical protein